MVNKAILVFGLSVASFGFSNGGFQARSSIDLPEHEEVDTTDVEILCECGEDFERGGVFFGYAKLVDGEVVKAEKSGPYRNDAACEAFKLQLRRKGICLHE